MPGALGRQFQFEGRGIDAVPFTGGCGPVIKNVTQVRPTPVAVGFGANRSERCVDLCTNRRVMDGTPVTGPSGPRIILRLGAVQRQATSDAVVNPLVFCGPVLARKGAFCALLTRDPVLLVREDRPPLVIGFYNLLTGNFDRFRRPHAVGQPRPGWDNTGRWRGLVFTRHASNDTNR